jgi:restriction system protein
LVSEDFEMALPIQSTIELPLLLELERNGGTVQKGAAFPAFYQRVTRHFPDITPEDLQLRLQSNKAMSVWENRVEWARLSLRRLGQLNGGQRGVWEITREGKERLRSELLNIGIASVEDFIRSNRSIRQETGALWKPAPRRARRQRLQAGKNAQTGQVGIIEAPPPHPLEPSRTTPAGPGQTGEPQRTIRDQLRTRLQSLNPAQFEYLVGEILKATGFSEVRVTGRSGDGGIDGECNLPFLRLKCAFQAKRYAPANVIGSPAMRNFKGGVVGRYDRGIFITTSTFSPGAMEEADQPGVTIITIDGQALVDLLIEKGLGIKTIPVVENMVDEEFFSRLAH